MSARQYRRTCDELGVCQERPIRCMGCKPSEGAASVQRLLAELGKRPLPPLVPEFKR